MNDERNPALARLFGEADRKLDDETFVADVMARTRTPRTWPFVIALVVLLVAAPVAWLLAGPLNDALVWLTQLLSRPIAGSGDGFTGPAVLPMNNVGAGLVLALLALRAIARRLFTVVP